MPATERLLAPPSPDDRHYRLMIDSALDYAIISCDPVGRVLSWNSGAQHLLGWTAAQAMGQTLHLIFTPEDVATGVVEAELSTALREGRAKDERWHQRRDGTRLWASGEVMPLRDEAGAPCGFVKLLRDRTAEQQEAGRSRQRELDLQFIARASEELSTLTDYQATLDTIARLAVPGFADWCTVDLVEADGSLRRVAMAHADRSRMAGAEEFHRLFPPDPRSTGGTWEVLRSGRPRLVREITPEGLERVLPDPQRRAAVLALGIHSYLAVPLITHGDPFGVLTFATAESRRVFDDDSLELAMDLAGRASVAIENARLLQVMREADRAKDVFLATLAHELRNPLAPIWNSLSIMKRAPGERQRVETASGVIERQVTQLSRLVDDLLEISRIGTGKIELRKEPASVVRLINAAVEMSRPHIEAAHHQLTVSFPDEPVRVLADPARMTQVFSNLLNNAAKYTRRGGRIDVVVQVQGEEIVVRVRDNGTGIAPEMLGHVFGLFAQLPQSDERHQGGLGIGLALVDGLVRLHGGHVEAHSQGQDQGSEFIVHLPRLGPGVPETRAWEPHPGALGVTPVGRRILVVDDNVDTATSLGDLLAMSGHEVDVVHDGGTAVERTASFRPDIVLLDIGLPDITGYEAARRIRQLEGVRQPMLVAVTGWGQPHDKQLAAEAGFDQHWTKPVDPARLLALSMR